MVATASAAAAIVVYPLDARQPLQSKPSGQAGQAVCNTSTTCVHLSGNYSIHVIPFSTLDSYYIFIGNGRKL